MLIGDRVVCDECLCVMGQLHHMPVEHSDLLSDFRTAPDYAVCPDCQTSTLAVKLWPELVDE